uniref:PIN_9 domain-containing protein n=1 Tax=Panagrellus redivivus TaxID=6233 RepID=A0A7E4V4D0_PANRE
MMPFWDTSLHVKDIIENKKPIYVADTLIIDCQTIGSYEKILPFICGTYSRVFIRGKLSWKQVERLIHPNVIKAEVDANIVFYKKEHDNVVKFCMERMSRFNQQMHLKNTLLIDSDVFVDCVGIVILSRGWIIITLAM